MTQSPRMRKVNSVIREVVADEIERLTDPRLELVSVTAVDTSPDLHSAVVFVSTVDLDRGPDAVEALTRAGARLQRAIACQVRLKYTPQLTFSLDTGVVAGERIDQLLRQISTTSPTEDHEDTAGEQSDTGEEEE